MRCFRLHFSKISQKSSKPKTHSHVDISRFLRYGLQKPLQFLGTPQPQKSSSLWEIYPHSQKTLTFETDTLYPYVLRFQIPTELFRITLWTFHCYLTTHLQMVLFWKHSERKFWYLFKKSNGALSNIPLIFSK